MGFSSFHLIQWSHMPSHTTISLLCWLIEGQLVKGLREDHSVIEGKANMPIIINALRPVPKKDSNELRLIMDCSRPLMMNANSNMALEQYKYVAIDDETNLCQPGCWLAKVDLKHAYRSVGTHLDSWRVTGISWCFNDSKHPTYLYDERLPLGARVSAMVFHRLTQAICRMVARRGYTVVAYLDDFLIIEPTQMQCKAAFDTLLNLLESLGFTVNWTKVAYAAQCLIFLGVEIDTVQCELRLSEDRVSELLSLLKGTSSKRKCTKLYLQRLLGKLYWAARVVRGDRTFLRRHITLANSVKQVVFHALMMSTTGQRSKHGSPNPVDRMTSNLTCRHCLSFSLDPRDQQQLDREVTNFRRQAYAPTPKSTYMSQASSYVSFCVYYYNTSPSSSSIKP